MTTKDTPLLPQPGNRLLIGLRPSPDLDPLDRQLLRSLQPAGVVLFKGNFDHEAPAPLFLARLRQLLADVRSAVGRQRILVGIDHEGGRVFRLPERYSNFGYARQWRPFAAEVGATFGRELASLGINLNFAPVLDVDSNPANPVIGPRAFASTVESVCDSAKAFMEAQLALGVQACGKHFPGHGDTETDSHYALPLLAHDRDTLMQRELAPFRAMASSRLPMMMSAHLMVPALDDAFPATASSRIVQDILRRQFGFKGVITTDDLGMNAVQPMLDDGDFVTRIAQAGHDVFMMCSAFISTDRLYEFTAHLARALEQGRIQADAWRASGERIARLLEASMQHDVVALDASLIDRHRLLAERITQSAS